MGWRLLLLLMRFIISCSEPRKARQAGLGAHSNPADSSWLSGQPRLAGQTSQSVLEEGGSCRQVPLTPGRVSGKVESRRWQGHH